MNQPLAGKPLDGVRVLDFSGLGPGPFASMILADFGADVLSLRRPGGLAIDPSLGLARGKDVLQIDLSGDVGRGLAALLAKEVDVVLEGFRPGVMERLGLGPEPLMAANPALIYARLTGWGQTGAYAQRAGHDINYLAISGALGVCGRDEPVAPPALLGDLANGSYLAVIGIVMALVERANTGRGRIVDAAITDGASYMLSALFAERSLGFWSGDPADHILSGNAPFYGTYRCADGGWFAVGAIEPKFYATLLDVLGLADVSRAVKDQMDQSGWPRLRDTIAARFGERSRADWVAAFEGHDACATPVLAIDELSHDPHLASRGTVRAGASGLYAAPAPRVDDAAPTADDAITGRGRPPEQVLRDFGIAEDAIAAAVSSGVVACPTGV